MDLYNVIWNGITIGNFQESHRDMWYLEGPWHPGELQESIAFEQILTKAAPRQFIPDPESAPRLVLRGNEQTLYALAIFLEGNHLLVRQIVDQKALDLFFPDRQLH